MGAEIYLMPLTLCSGMIDGAEQWDSYKAIHRTMKTGKAADARAVGEAIIKDMSDPQKAKAYTEGIRRAEVSMRAAEILRRDKGKLAQMMQDAEKAYIQSKSAIKKKKAMLFAWDVDYKRHMEAVNKICEGADEKALGVIEETSKAIAQYRNEVEKLTREYEEQKAEADRLYQTALNLASSQAKREMLQDAERARKRREKRAQMQRAESAAEKETKAMAEQERAEEKTPPQEERENE